MAKITGSSYVEGNLAPIREETTATELTVTGTLPDFLDGRYLRNGPNPIGDIDPATYHWFAGTGMVHGVRLRDGRAEWYRNRWVRSESVAEALGEEWAGGPTHAGMDFAANTHVIGHAGRTFAIVEAGSRPYELTETLDTVGPSDFGGTLPGGFTAHPKLDPTSGELHAMAYFWGWENKVQYIVVGRDGRVRRTVDVPTTGMTMMHDFSLTERHVVVYDLPVTFDLEKAGEGKFPYTWDPEYPARVGVMTRGGDGRDLEWFDVEQCYVYHPLNAYDDGDHIVLDVVRHPKTFATDHHGPFEGDPLLWRWTVDRIGGKVTEEQLDDLPQEFPRVDERLTGRRHRYGYSVGFDPATQAQAQAEAGEDRMRRLAMPRALLRHDLVAGTTEAHRLGADVEPGEFVFVPSGPDAAEDDGVLMGFAYDRSTDRSDLVVLDARSFDRVATVHLPVRVPQGFHGSWVPSAG